VQLMKFVRKRGNNEKWNMDFVPTVWGTGTGPGVLLYVVHLYKQYTAVCTTQANIPG
jgi:hypothetical protein